MLHFRLRGVCGRLRFRLLLFSRSGRRENGMHVEVRTLPCREDTSRILSGGIAVRRSCGHVTSYSTTYILKYYKSRERDH
jgi:hypothetical protein